MSHLVLARIDGLAGRKDEIEIKFDRGVNIVFGLNGSGKTSLLKIIHSAMSGDAKMLENVPFKSASVEIYSITYKRTFLRQITRGKPIVSEVQDEIPDEIENRIDIDQFVSSHVLKQAQLHWKQSPKDSQKEGLTRWQHRYLPTTRLHISDDPFAPLSIGRRENTLTEEILDQFFANSLTHLWARYSSELVRVVRDAQAKGLARILQAVLSTTTRKKRSNKKQVDLNKAYESVKKFLERQGAKQMMRWHDFERRYQTDNSLQGVVEDIYRIEQEIDKAMSTKRQLQSLIEKLYSGNKHIIFTDDAILVNDENNKGIGLATLSSGEKHLMRLLVETLLAKENTILIDEPELSMHVDWQRALVSNMRLLNPRAQLIMATHSPEIMAEVADEKIISL